MQTKRPFLNTQVLFHLLAFANLIPVWLTTYIGSLDGPQHLYISQVISQLWISNPVFEQFYQFSTPIIGNQTGNLLLAVFNSFLPASLAEKMLITTYLLGLSYAFKYLIVSLSGRLSWLTFLIFPFSYHTFFLQGYYNFSLGFVFMFWSIGWWTSIKSQLDVRKAAIMGLLLLLSYFTHLFVFGMLLFILAMLAMAKLFELLMFSRNKDNLRSWVKQNLILLVLTIPGIILSFLYFNLIPVTSPSQIDTAFLVDYLKGMKILIGFRQQPEMTFTVPFLIFLIVLTIGILASKIHARLKNKNGNRGPFQVKKDTWLVISLLLLMVIFLFSYNMPAGSIETRLLITMFYVLLVWLSVQRTPKWIQLTTLAVVLLFSISIRSKQHADIKNLDLYIQELKEIEQHCEENSIIMSMNFSNNWTHHHLRNYIGIDKPIVNIHTEAISPYFLVDWNRKQMPDIYMGTQAIYRFNHFSHPYESDTAIILEYIVVWGYKVFENPDFEDLYKTALLRDYDRVLLTSGGNGGLFKLKRKDWSE